MEEIVFGSISGLRTILNHHHRLQKLPPGTGLYRKSCRGDLGTGLTGKDCLSKAPNFPTILTNFPIDFDMRMGKFEGESVEIVGQIR